MRAVVAGWIVFTAIVASAAMAGESAPRYVGVPGGSFKTALRYEDAKGKNVRVEPYALMRTPVTNAHFLAFVQAHPEWQRDRVPKVFAEERYLQHWAGPTTLGADAQPGQPVTWVSWFAADAYCQSIDARLPTWSEWEYAAAADERHRDARND